MDAAFYKGLNMKIVEKAIYNLLQNEPFYAQFALNSRIAYDKFNVPTAGATVINGIPLIVFNTEYLKDKTADQVESILKHEILHLLFMHTNMDYYKIENEIEKKIYNIAMDCAINQYIYNLPEGCVSIETLQGMTKIQLEEWQTTQYYYNALMQEADKFIHIQTQDEHDMDAGQTPADIQMARGAISKAAGNATKAAAGQVPEGLQSVIGELSSGSQINWKQLFRNFIANSTSTKIQNTRKKINRRFGLEHPGKRKKKELALAVCLDSSGSVDDKSFSAFIAEVVSMSAHVSRIELIYADSEVQHVERVKGPKDVPKMRYGNGGTAYQPAISKALELNVDAICYFGDFDSSDTPVNPGKPFLWIGVGQQPPPADFGHVIRIN
jgi:predicted metal-dependent peptidase